MFAAAFGRGALAVTSCAAGRPLMHRESLDFLEAFDHVMSVQLQLRKCKCIVPRRVVKPVPGASPK